MERIARKPFQLLFSLALVACLMVWLAPVAAAHTRVLRNGPDGVGQYVITNVTPTGDLYEDEDSVLIAPGTSANITKSWTASNAFTATVGIDARVVSAQLGYDVTASTEVSETCSANVNTTSFDQLLEWETQFVAYDFDIYWYNNLTGQQTKVGTGWTKKYNQPRCAIYDTDHVEE